MKAIILASGEGKRLRPITNKIPKPLIKIDKDTILDHQIKNLIGCRIEDIIITTGPFSDKIKEHIGEKNPNLNVQYVGNPMYHTTNYIYSLWLTKKLIDDDIILLHGDLLFNIKLMEMLVQDKHPNCVPVNKRIKPPEKDFKAVIENGRVTKIGIKFYGKNTFYSAPLYKFSKSDFLRWFDKIEEFIKRGDLKSYAEDAFNEISNDIPLYPLYFNKELCMEIDTKEDLEMARKLLSKR